MADGAWLVVGLGNPGPQHAQDRHNAGAMVVDELATRSGAGFRPHRARALVAEARLGVLPGGRPGPRVVLARPTSWMNEAGGPVAGLVRFYGVDVERVLVVHDELDLPFGAVRLKRGGGEGGHNGLRDITKALSTKDYARLRVGIGRPPGRTDPADFVLRGFSSTERKELPFLLGDAADAVELVVTAGLDAAQQRYHGPR
ncbi:aminoacyl-tRNA hydrolase [Quadrisphaera sp. DSM 44207]|uniref:aminoacyl-tRNA hydrolase n=1 Tax=Quadrisphaera sp. DSM 44207 TaxID=1881057 RepID=UPI000891F14E|nr:aminoacyl-tRNA hydrolase [Quadrisphaera sp. DSM 44207]SDQ68395.1 peptidyl-tRNA hydrolase [Quadrisphaera sp. DSM 44207]